MQVGTEVFLRPIFDVKEAKRESLLFKQLEKSRLLTTLDNLPYSQVIRLENWRSR